VQPPPLRGKAAQTVVYHLHLRTTAGHPPVLINS
ncbi:hypothetical protein L195_g004056, partial [Trifolium pratense]